MKRKNPWIFATLTEDRIYYVDKAGNDALWSWQVNSRQQLEGRTKRVMRVGSAYYFNLKTKQLSWVQKRHDNMERSGCFEEHYLRRGGFLPRLGKREKRTVKKVWKTLKTQLRNGNDTRRIVRDQRYSKEVMVSIDYKDVETLFRGTASVGKLNGDMVNFFITKLSNTLLEKDSKVSVHIFNTYFFEALRRCITKGEDPRKLKLGLKHLKYDIGECDRIIVPINVKGMHWAVTVIDKQFQTFRYYDSDKNDVGDFGAFQILLPWIKTLWKLENAEHWQHLLVKNLPKQENDYDCGIFMMKYMADMVFEIPFNFAQKDMKTIRKQIATICLEQ